MESCIVHFMRISPRAKIPMQAYAHDAGWDLHVLDSVDVAPGGGMDVRTGIHVAMPPGYYGRIVGRSSAMRKKGVMVMEGIIDAGFRGELFSYVYNPQLTEIVRLAEGESVAQLIISPIPRVYWHERTELENSERGEAGFGSSGR